MVGLGGHRQENGLSQHVVNRPSLEHRPQQRADRQRFGGGNALQEAGRPVSQNSPFALPLSDLMTLPW